MYTALNVLDHLRAASLYDGVAPDPRAAGAVEIVRAARQPDGRWLQGRRYRGQVWFDVGVAVGDPSPWLTFLATRVLDWWDEGPQPEPGDRRRHYFGWTSTPLGFFCTT